MNSNTNEVISSEISMMVSDAMAASMGVLVIIISLLLIDTKEEYQQKLLELNTVQSSQNGITSDKFETTNILLENRSITIAGNSMDTKKFRNINDFDKAVPGLLTARGQTMFAIYAEGQTPFQYVIDITDVLIKHYPESTIDIGAIDK